MARVAKPVEKEKEKVVINGGGRKRKVEEESVAEPAKTTTTTKKAPTKKAVAAKTTTTTTTVVEVNSPVQPIALSPPDTGVQSQPSTAKSERASKASRAFSSESSESEIAEEKKPAKTKARANKTKAPAKAPASPKVAAKAKAPAKSKAPAKAKTTAKISPSKKRKANELVETAPDAEGDIDASGEEVSQSDADSETRAAKKTKTTEAPAKYVAAMPKPKNAKVVHNRKSDPLSVFSFGNGDMGELGLGGNPKARNVGRPRLNPFLPRDTVGVVDLAIGGMHGMVLTKDGKVLTWGVNDQKALGRSTDGWSAPEKDADADDSDDDDSDVGEINPLESTPAEVEGLPPGVNIAAIAASDNLSCAVTDTGFVYSWGTFRCSEGIMGFSETDRIIEYPVLLPNIKNIIEIVAGTDHVIALSSNGAMYAWGNGQQCQLGRRIIDRTRLNATTPREFGPKKIKTIGSGSYHSFAVGRDGKVWAWGLNQYGQCGVSNENTDEGDVVSKPTRVPELEKYDIVQITGGEHHSAALTADGKILTWGRLDSAQLGIPKSEYANCASLVKDDSGRERYIYSPTVLKGLPPMASIACGTNHNIAISRDGHAYSWGYNEMKQVGQGMVGDDVEVPTMIDNTAVKNVDLKLAGGGGQFSIIAGTPKDTPVAPLTNGVKSPVATPKTNGNA